MTPGWSRLWLHSYRLGFRWLLRGLFRGWGGWRVGVARLLIPLDPWRYYELGRVADEQFQGLNLDVSSPKLLASLLRHERCGNWLGIDRDEREVAALTAALGAVRGPDAARLLSEAEGAGTVLVAVVLGQTCLGGLLFFLDVLAARGALRCRFRLVLGLAIAHVIGTSALLRSVGPEGAALAILLSSAVGFGATAWLTRGAVGPFLPWRCVTRAVVAAAAAAALVALFPRPGGVGALLAQLAAGGGVYLLCLWGAGERWQTGNRP